MGVQIFKLPVPNCVDSTRGSAGAFFIEKTLPRTNSAQYTPNIAGKLKLSSNKLLIRQKNWCGVIHTAGCCSLQKVFVV
ncbi:MAG: hypothetical protein A2359_03085 [Candidatus Moranbacteria bacterium RIFOXYB1_FULL_43_19]|nr:MAG: hypothetical protein A2359_03085 [Candidatus Moranbacteria bacterium RIFOXYB1_FULL_43_19]OGI28533.1 MAG: hypothetical protein A2184_00685 [Candidatus Moranbacteria bacterium RIFOXYA1_FULL_44_7]OGI33663.1 MAG: hypothetical protein A2420_02345 [Candidatus Moranbacteria bacterium RIFOXYC1_FULL_44_13]OGI37206.1 MAG: hypothetical protein A2612_03955 [Candidatus Moranbacteria bacterium RIFOXYD1_FULL_44_12]